jgi:hypothetical protein
MALVLVVGSWLAGWSRLSLLRALGFDKPTRDDIARDKGFVNEKNRKPYPQWKRAVYDTKSEEAATPRQYKGGSRARQLEQKTRAHSCPQPLFVLHTRAFPVPNPFNALQRFSPNLKPLQCLGLH